jgi:hypothetical protein
MLPLSHLPPLPPTVCTPLGSHDQSDPIWRLPLHKGYRRLLDSKVCGLSMLRGTTTRRHPCPTAICSPSPLCTSVSLCRTLAC